MTLKYSIQQENEDLAVDLAALQKLQAKQCYNFIHSTFHTINSMCIMLKDLKDKYNEVDAGRCHNTLRPEWLCSESISLMIFCIFLPFTKSHEKIKASSELILTSITCSLTWLIGLCLRGLLSAKKTIKNTSARPRAALDDLLLCFRIGPTPSWCCKQTTFVLIHHRK